MGTYEDYKYYLSDEYQQVIDAAMAFALAEQDGEIDPITITEHSGGGETDGTRVTIPSTTGPGIIPINDAIYTKATFLQYDKEAALVHELNHAVLSYLQINDTHELKVAVLAAAADEVRSKLNILSSDSNYLMAFGYGLKKILTGDAGIDFLDDSLIPIVEQSIVNVPVWDDTIQLQKARTSNASFESRHLLLNSHDYGLSYVSSLYRTGYASHEDVGAFKSIDHDEWTSFGPGVNGGVKFGRISA